MSIRVAILGLYHESNTFIQTPTTLRDFENGHLLRGKQIQDEYEGAHHEIGGMLEVLRENDIEPVPLLFAEATPGGTITRDTYQQLLNEMLDALRGAGRVDGCMVAPHGAGVAEGFPDMDGHWLGELRKLLGPHIPIIGTMDPHANVSPAMVDATNALVAYATNPHVDQRATGRRAALLMVRTLRKEIMPTQALIQPAVAISIEQQYTSAEPCVSLYRRANEIAGERGVLSVSIQLGFPYADVPEMGTSFIVVTNNDPARAKARGEQLRTYIETYKKEFVAQKPDPLSAIRSIGKDERPALLLDMGDNVGGGAPGNSTVLLHALEQTSGIRSFVCIYDPAAALEACAHAPGEKFRLAFGDDGGIFGTGRFEGEVELINTVDGPFSEKNPRHGGQAHYNMGRTAVVKTVKGNTVMLNSLRIPPFSLNQLLSADIHPEGFDVIVAKGVNAPIAAYGPVCKKIIQVNTPGPTQADMTKFHFLHRRKPLFPFE